VNRKCHRNSNECKTAAEKVKDGYKHLARETGLGVVCGRERERERKEEEKTADKAQIGGVRSRKNTCCRN
jgi:hypothetical protein